MVCLHILRFKTQFIFFAVLCYIFNNNNNDGARAKEYYCIISFLLHMKCVQPSVCLLTRSMKSPRARDELGPIFETGAI